MRFSVVPKSSKNGGVTLVEVLVYLALFGLIFVSIIEFAISISQSNRVAGKRTEIEKSVITVTQHFSDTVPDGISIDDLNSVYDDDNGVLRVILDPGYVEYRIENGRVVVDRDGILNYLTNPEYYVNKLRFEKILSRSGVTTGVRLTFMISSSNDSSVTTTIITSYMLK